MKAIPSAGFTIKIVIYFFQGGYKVSPEGFGFMTQMLTSLAMGRVILVLEVRANESGHFVNLL